MEDKGKLLETIKKLLALSTSPNEHEAASSAAKVQELLFKYKLTMAEVETHKGKEKGGAQVIDIGVDVTSQKNYGRWKPRLANSIACYNFCYALSIGKSRLVIIGQPQDVEVVKELYNWLVLQLEDRARRACLEYTGASRVPTFRRSFFVGATTVIRNRLYHQWKNLSEQSNASMALVVRSKELIDRYVSGKWGPTHSQHIRVSNGSIDGLMAGRRAGSEIDIHLKRKITGGPEALPEG